MHLLVRQAGLGSSLHRGVHKGTGAADEQRRRRPGPQPGRELGHRGHTLHAVQPVLDLQPLRVSPGQLVERVAEDDRAFVAVGVEQRHAPRASCQYRAQDGQHGCDAAATGQQHEVAVKRAWREHACRRQHLQRVARAHLVAQPVGAEASSDALDCHAQAFVQARRAGHGVASGQLRYVAALHGQTQRDELASVVGEGLRLIRRHLKDEGLGVGRLVHHCAHAQGDVAGVGGVGHVVRASGLADARPRAIFLGVRQEHTLMTLACSTLTAPRPEWPRPPGSPRH